MNNEKPDPCPVLMCDRMPSNALNCGLDCSRREGSDSDADLFEPKEHSLDQKTGEDEAMLSAFRADVERFMRMSAEADGLQNAAQLSRVYGKGYEDAWQASRQSAEDRDGETIAFLLGLEEGKDKAEAEIDELTVLCFESQMREDLLKDEIKRYREALSSIAYNEPGWSEMIDIATEALNQGEKNG